MINTLKLKFIEVITTKQHYIILVQWQLSHITYQTVHLLHKLKSKESKTYLKLSQKKLTYMPFNNRKTPEGQAL